MLEHTEMGRMTPLIKDWKDLLLELGDNQSLLGSLKESQYYKPFEKQASIYESNMADLGIYLGALNRIQRKWLYLEPIFGRGALPPKRSASSAWMKILLILCTALRRSRYFSTCAAVHVQGLNRPRKWLRSSLRRLPESSSRLSRRETFSHAAVLLYRRRRLLGILGQSQNPKIIQTHLKLFQGITQSYFSSDESKLVAMYGAKANR